MSAPEPYDLVVLGGGCRANTAIVRLESNVRELAEMVHIHPALNESLLAAAVKVVAKVRGPGCIAVLPGLIGAPAEWSRQFFVRIRHHARQNSHTGTPPLR